MSPDVREALAQAYERGDGEAAGKLYGAWLLNLPLSPAGPPGKLAKLGAIVKPGDGGKAAQTVVPGAGGNVGQVPNGSTAGTGAAGATADSAVVPGANLGSRITGTNAGFDTANLQSKLEGYLLDPVHSQNQTKAMWFQQSLGFNKSNWQQLGAQITFNESIAIATKTTQYGQTFEQVMPIIGANGRSIDVSFIFMKDNMGTVRLVTGFQQRNEKIQRKRCDSNTRISDCRCNWRGASTNYTGRYDRYRCVGAWKPYESCRI